MPAGAAGANEGRAMTAAQFNIPKWLQTKVHSCPESPFGVHQWLYLTARHLHRHLEPAEIETILADAVKNCGREVKAQEIRQAVQSAANAFKPSA